MEVLTKAENDQRRKNWSFEPVFRFERKKHFEGGYDQENRRPNPKDNKSSN